jgi:predicted MFS family arabinose efflux permease
MSDQSPPPSATKPGLRHPFSWINVARFLAGLTVGLLIAFVLVIAVELASAVVHPFPPDFKGTQEEMCAHVARYPQWFLALAVPAWGLTAFAGTWTANRVGNRPAALFVGLLLTAVVLCNVSMLPYPIWFKIASPIVVIAAVFAATRSR